MEKLITTSFDSPIFNIVQKVLHGHFKDYSAEKVEKIIKINGLGAGTYKFVVEWQDENQSSLDIFKVMENV